MDETPNIAHVLMEVGLWNGWSMGEQGSVKPNPALVITRMAVAKFWFSLVKGDPYLTQEI